MSVIAVNALSLRPDGAGVSTYIRELLASFDPQTQRTIHAIVQRDAIAELPPEVHALGQPICSGVRRALLAKARSPQASLYHGLDVDLPLRTRSPLVSTFHDLSVFDQPWAFSAVRVRGEQLQVRHAGRRADVLIAVSEFTAERIRHWLHRDSVVIPHGPGRDLAPASAEEIATIRRRYQLPDSFVLHVGTIEPRKDLNRLAEACKQADVPLIAAGGEWGNAEHLPSTVRRLGFVPRADLAALYGAATVTAYVSVYEGFGLPPIEAMVCGATVMCSDVASLRPLLGEQACYWVPVADLTGQAQAVRDLMGDAALRETLAAAGQRAASGLSFDRAAQDTLKVWNSLL